MEEKDEESREDVPRYMDELAKAYAAAFAKRVTRSTQAMGEEKRERLTELQTETIRIAGTLSSGLSEEKRELIQMLKESAEEALGILGGSSKTEQAGSEARTPRALLLSRAVVLVNRSVNLLIRHSHYEERLLALFLSEASALYALAAIN